jgi:hypothetical protein
MIRKIGIVGALIVVLYVLYHLFGIPIAYSEGDRSGVVYKMSQKGYIIKTWEGEFNMGVVGPEDKPSQGSAAMKIWNFSVSDPKVAKIIEEHEQKGDRVTLHYKQPFVMGAWFGKSDSLVTKVLEQNQ